MKLQSTCVFLIIRKKWNYKVLILVNAIEKLVKGQEGKAIYETVI